MALRWLARGQFFSVFVSLLMLCVTNTVFSDGVSAASPAGRDQSVIAQGITSLPEGKVNWVVVHTTADASAYAQAIERAPGFIVADSGSFFVTDAETGLVQQLDGRSPEAGSAEAAFVAGGSHQARSSLAERKQAPSYFEISLVASGADGAIGDEFDAPKGLRELTLIQGDTSTSESVTIAASGNPILLISTAGDLSVTQSGGVDGVLKSREAVLLAPGAETTVHGESGNSSYVAAFIGEELDLGFSTPVSGPTEAPPAQTESVPVPTPATNNDPDYDGLTNDVEAQWGTDPLNPDSDGDGLYDGDEVYVYGTNPLNADTDGDGYSDYTEVMEMLTNPTIFNGTPVIDSDGDGVLDSDEINNGTDPYDPNSY